MQSYGTAPPRIGKVAPGTKSGLIGSAMQSVPKKKPRHIEVRAHVRRKPKKANRTFGR